MTDREKLYDRWMISLMCGSWILSVMTGIVSDWLIPAGFARGLVGVAALSGAVRLRGLSVLGLLLLSPGVEVIPFLLLALLPGGTCGCPPDVPPWQIVELPLGTTSPGEVGWPAVYLESLSPPEGEWCYVGDHTHWLCSGVFDSPRCFGQWVAVGRLPIEPSSRWVVIFADGENCHPCHESGCMSRIFRDGFESGDTRRWSLARG